MKRSLLLLSVLMLSVSAAHATCPPGSTKPYPECLTPSPPPPPPAPPPPAPAPPSKLNSNSDAAAAAKAQAEAKAAADAKAQAAAIAAQQQAQLQAQQQATKVDVKAAGGNAAAAGGSGTGGNATSGPSSAVASGSGTGGSNQLGNISAGNDQSTSSFRSYLVNLPSAVFTPPLPMSTCPQANVDQSAVAIGWNFFSHAKGSVNTDNCTAIIIYNNFLEQCKFRSAHAILNSLTLKILPGFEAEKATWLDLTPAECAALKMPVVFPPVPPVTNYVYVEKTCPTPAPTPKVVPKGKKKIVKKAPRPCTP